MDDQTDDYESAPRYSFRPSMMGAPREFALRNEGLHWRIGRHSATIPYRSITALRLSYRPISMQSHRFLAEIWAPGMPKLMLASTSCKNLVEHERQDKAYLDFLTALHERIVAAGGTPLFIRGMPRSLYGPAIAVFVLITIGLLVLFARGLAEGAFGGVAFIAAFFALFLWQIGSIFRRNLPGSYLPQALPQAVIPVAKAP